MMEVVIITFHSIVIISESSILHDTKYSCRLIITLLYLTRATVSQLIKINSLSRHDELAQRLILTSISIILAILSEKSSQLHTSSLEIIISSSSPM